MPPSARPEMFQWMTVWVDPAFSARNSDGIRSKIWFRMGARLSPFMMVAICASGVVFTSLANCFGSRAAKLAGSKSLMRCTFRERA